MAHDGKIEVDSYLLNSSPHKILIVLRLLLLTSSLILTAIFAIAATREIGYRANVSWNLETEYTCSPEPCWHGIYPGITSLTEAEWLLHSDRGIKLYEKPDETPCWTGPTS